MKVTKNMTGGYMMLADNGGTIVAQGPTPESCLAALVESGRVALAVHEHNTSPLNAAAPYLLTALHKIIELTRQKESASRFQVEDIALAAINRARTEHTVDPELWAEALAESARDRESI